MTYKNVKIFLITAIQNNHKQGGWMPEKHNDDTAYISSVYLSVFRQYNYSLIRLSSK